MANDLSLCEPSPEAIIVQLNLRTKATFGAGFFLAEVGLSWRLFYYRIDYSAPFSLAVAERLAAI